VCRPPAEAALGVPLSLQQRGIFTCDMGRTRGKFRIARARSGAGEAFVLSNPKDMEPWQMPAPPGDRRGLIGYDRCRCAWQLG
jgi:hypothetical protein